MSTSATDTPTATSSDIQRQLESAIMRANEAEIRRLIAQGGDVDVPPIDPSFRRKVNPNEDSGITILAHVVDSGIEVCTTLKFDHEDVPRNGKVRPSGVLRTYDMRWMDVRRLLLSEGGGISGWRRIPRGWGDQDYIDMNDVCVQLFGAHAALSKEGNTLVDRMVRNQASVDKKSYQVRMSQFVDDLGVLLSSLDMCSASVELGGVTARLALEGEEDLSRRGHTSAYAVALCMSICKLEIVAPEVKDVLTAATWGAFEKQKSLLDLAWCDVPGVDSRLLLTRLLALGCDPNRPLPDTGRTPLMGAVKTMSVESIDVLLKAGGDTRAKDLKGRTAEDYIPPTAAPQSAEAVKACLRAWDARASIAVVAERARRARDATRGV